MRKTFFTLASLIMSLVMCISFLGGCNLITVDSERDMNQVVATVKISDDAPMDKIYKKDIVMAYLNYGYMYEYSYGYTREKVIDFIVNQLITTRVYVQNAVQQFNTSDPESIFYGEVENIDTDKKWDLEQYLDNEEKLDAEYSTVKDMNDLIKNYVENEGEKVSDTLIGTVRTVPTGAANKEKEIDKQAYIDKGVDTDSTTERREAYNEVIELLEANELLGDEFDGKIETTTYYKETLKGYQETKLLEKFEKVITDAARAEITYGDLQDKYLNDYEEQAEMSTSEFAEKLSSATAESPVLVSNAKGYGYVYNLLLGASDAQTSKIQNIKTKDIAERAEERKEILDSTIVKDLRSTWILSGYDFDGEKFTGDYTFTKDAENSLPFKGVAELINPITDGDEPEDYVKKYKVDSVKEFTLGEFVDMMEMYLYDEPQSPAGAPVDSILDENVVYKRVSVDAGTVGEYEAKINELLFAFSTDDGSLNTYKGYVIDPVPVDGNETYMQEFADAGRELIKMGGNSYIMVATDYGYHVMFYSQAFDNYDYETLEGYLNYITNTDGDKGNADFWTEKLQKDVLELWDNEDKLDTDSFLYKFYNSIATTKVNAKLTKEQNRLLNDHVYSTKGGVVRYPNTYADLLEA